MRKGDGERGERVPGLRVQVDCLHARRGQGNGGGAKSKRGPSSAWEGDCESVKSKGRDRETKEGGGVCSYCHTASLHEAACHKAAVGVSSCYISPEHLATRVSHELHRDSILALVA